MTLPLSLLPLASLLTIGAALAQENQPALTPLEKDFQESMSSVTLAGRSAREDGKLSEDKYVIEKATKVKDDLWRFDAHMQYGGQDMKVPVMLHVKWAGDTPVLVLTDEAIAGMGKFTVRIVIYRGQYAGTWSGGQGHGGQMFGSIVKTPR
jgi:hypothetical protein